MAGEKTPFRGTESWEQPPYLRERRQTVDTKHRRRQGCSTQSTRQWSAGRRHDESAMGQSFSLSREFSKPLSVPMTMGEIVFPLECSDEVHGSAYNQGHQGRQSIGKLCSYSYADI